MHRGYLGPLQHAYLAGMTAGQKHAAAEHGLEILVPADRMFYICAFQAGVERFICGSVHDGAQQLPFLRPRLSRPKGKLEIGLIARVSDAIKAHSLSQEDCDGLSDISAFLTSLLGAMQHNAAMLSVMPLPDPAEISRLVAPGLAMPLIQLIAELKPVAESLPIPISAVDRSNVSRFQELLDTDTFSAYSGSHETFNDERNETATSLSLIRDTGNALIEKGRGVLTRKPMLIHLLNVFPKIVDNILGKLPGALAQLATDAAQGHMRDQQRVIIYQFDEWITKALRFRECEAGVVEGSDL